MYRPCIDITIFSIFFHQFLQLLSNWKDKKSHHICRQVLFDTQLFISLFSSVVSLVCILNLRWPSSRWASSHPLFWPGQASVANAKMYTRRRSACAATLAASQLPYRVQDCSHHVQSIKIWSTLLSFWLDDPSAASSYYEIRRSMSSVPNSQTSSQGFCYAVPLIWNLLPPDLRIKETVAAFKTVLCSG